MRKCCSCVSKVGWMSIAVRIVAVIKALAVAEAKLCDWKLAVVLWAIVCLPLACTHVGHQLL